LITAATANRTEDGHAAFPADFWWGAATAAYQIEGSVSEDGRSASIWDTFCATPGRIAGAHTGEPAADHYRRSGDDVAMMAGLGLDAYRFSVSWPRIQPGGRGPENRSGSAFYDRLVDDLLAAGIKPAVTLYHWDLPQELEDAGGWTNRDTAYRFAEYSALVAERLGDRVQLWCTLNEPWCSAFLGYGSGAHAPGRIDDADALVAAHHLLLAHGLGARAVRSVLPSAPISISLNRGAVRAVSADQADVDAARRVDGLLNRLFLDPILTGSYPADVIADTAAVTDWSFVQDGDLATIGVGVDALGVNYYQPDLVGAADEPVSGPWCFPGSRNLAFHHGPGPVTEMGWTVDPTGLLEVLLRLERDHPGLPVMVTENGAAYPDQVGADGQVADPHRISYLHSHLLAAHEALSAGVDLRGYFVWSLLDNFEWALGYAKRFGLIHVDYDTQTRTAKDSAHWYRQVIAAGGVPLTLSGAAAT
jgi:beta-glucosidase